MANAIFQMRVTIPSHPLNYHYRIVMLELRTVTINTKKHPYNEDVFLVTSSSAPLFMLGISIKSEILAYTSGL